MPARVEDRINGYVNLKAFDDARHWVGNGPACALCNDCALFYHKGNQFGCTASSLGGAPGTLAAHDCSEGRQPTGCKQYKKQTATASSGAGSAASTSSGGGSGFTGGRTAA